MSFLIILMATPVGAVTTDSPESVSKVAVSNEIVSSGNIAGARVIADEGDSLYTTVLDNGDGTRTMTLHGYPVKYINDSGKIQDISLEITNTTEGAYKTKANSVQTIFPKTLSEGISLSNDDVSIKLKPRVSTASHGVAVSKSISEQISADFSVTKIDNKTVSYYYDSKTTLQYSLTYTGFKEDIVVSKYTGQTEYQFLLETGGLTLTKIDGSYYLTDGSGEIKATLGDIIIFTADEKNNTLGSMTHITVKENEQYILTIHVDASWLRDKNTAYPIRIDPTIEVSYDNNGASAIQDVTINSTAGSSGSSGSIYVGKRATYGISRTLMKFPGLNLNGIAVASDITSAYVQIRDLLCQTTNMAVCGYIFAGNNWSESTANWSNVSADAWTEMPDAIVNVNYSNGASKNPAHRYSINITQAVRSWKTGFYSQSTGIMLKSGDDVEYGSGELYKTFASYNRASNKPSLVVTYNYEIDVDSVTLSHNYRDMIIGDKFQLNATINPSNASNQALTWTSSNPAVATVSSVGLITALKSGEAIITVRSVSSGRSANCTIYVEGPELFSDLLSEGVISAGNIKYTDDGFRMINKSLSDILISAGISQVVDSEGNSLPVDKYYDDWFIYTLPDNNGQEYAYSLLKMREQENDGYDDDNPGVTISFIYFIPETLLTLINSNTSENSLALYLEVDRVVRQRGQTHDATIKSYFSNTSATAPYFIAENYIKHIASFASAGSVCVPNNYISLYQINPNNRVSVAVNSNNSNAGFTVCNHSVININNKNNLSTYEKYAILFTYTASSNYNSFAAEVQFHAQALENIYSIYSDAYESAIRADMAIGEEEESGFADQYYDLNSSIVQAQAAHHGNY